MQFDRHARLAFVVAVATLATCGFGFKAAINRLNAFLNKEPVPLRESFAQIPRRLGNWEKVGADDKLTDASVEALGTDQYLNRMYGRLDEPSASPQSLHIAYYTGIIDAVPHVPDRCLVANGFEPASPPSNIALPIDRAEWRDDPERVNLATGERYPTVTYRDPITGRPFQLRMPVGPLQLRTTEFRHVQQPQHRIFAGYLFIANGHTTPWPEEVRLKAFDLTSRHAYYCKVQFTMDASRGETRDEFIALATDLLNELLPEIMRCLPDWAEIERESQSESTTDPTSS